MKATLLCLLCLVIGTGLGAYLVAFGENLAVNAIIECIKTPGSCGLEEEDLDPQEQLFPA
jgi:hypothetical protein